MTEFSYNTWQFDGDNKTYGFDLSFVWRGDEYGMSGSRMSPTQCWEAACAFMIMVCK